MKKIKIIKKKNKNKKNLNQPMIELELMGI